MAPKKNVTNKNDKGGEWEPILLEEWWRKLEPPKPGRGKGRRGPQELARERASERKMKEWKKMLVRIKETKRREIERK